MPHLLTEVPGHCQVMQQEIFGPLLPLVPYDDIEALAYGGPGPRPGALSDEPGRDVAAPPHRETHAGAWPSTSLFQVARTMPLRRHRSLGMGHYHGREGFLTFSRPRPCCAAGASAQAPSFHPLSALVPSG